MTSVWAQQGQELLDPFEENVTTFTLDNGLDFIVVEQDDAPVISFYTYADVGSVNEVPGITGLSHMFEHMAFKGTTTVGTTDIDAEEAALEEVEETYGELKAATQPGVPADSARVQELAEAFTQAIEAAEGHIERGEFEKAIERAGGTGLNATTGADRTDYFYSLPANKLELWFSLESDRFLNPVLRDFYTERDVVQEERRMRTESSPTGRLFEEFITTAFKAHPYGQPVVGHMADLQSFTASEAEDFFETYYGAQNLTIALVGDVDPDEAEALAETYFGRLPKGEEPPQVETVEPEQKGERRVTIREETQPFVFIGYHKGSINDPDDAAYSVLADVLGRGRTSRLYERLVEDEQIALQTGAFTGFPGEKYPNLFVFYAVPNQGRTPAEAEEAIYAILDSVQAGGVTEEELEMAKTRARADLVRQLESRSGVGRQLVKYAVLTGDWRNFFRQLDAIEAVTAADVQRVAKETFKQGNRTVAAIETTSGEAAPTADAGEAEDEPTGEGS